MRAPRNKNGGWPIRLSPAYCRSYVESVARDLRVMPGESRQKRLTACFRLSCGGLLEIPGFCGVLRKKKKPLSGFRFPRSDSGILSKRLNNYKPGSSRLRNFFLGAADLPTGKRLCGRFGNQFLVSDFHGLQAVFSDVSRNQRMGNAVQGGDLVNRQESWDSRHVFHAPILFKYLDNYNGKR
jgi:hypothetical protein